MIIALLLQVNPGPSSLSQGTYYTPKFGMCLYLKARCGFVHSHQVKSCLASELDTLAHAQTHSEGLARYHGKYGWLANMVSLVTGEDCRWLYIPYTVVSRKRAHGWCTLLRAQTQGGGQIFVTSLHFTTKSAMFTSSQPTSQHTRPVQALIIQFSVYSSQACVPSHKRTSAGFQEKDSKFRILLVNLVV